MRTLRLLAASLRGLALAQLAVATCRLPVELPPGTLPSGAALGPKNSLVLSSKTGSIFFVDLSDFAVTEDTGASDYREHYGAFDPEGVAMVDPNSSSFIYIGVANKPAILEYEWYKTKRIYREFALHGIGDAGLRSMTFVPSDASSHLGYFYVGCRSTGNILVFELPLFDKTGNQAQAVLKGTWTPAEARGSRHIAGMSYSQGYIFLSYDEEDSSHLLIYPIQPNGLHGDLAEQYQVDVVNAQGLAARWRGAGTWEILMGSGEQHAVFAYNFRFVTGFQQHEHCGRGGGRNGVAARRGSSSARPPGGVSAALLASAAMASVAW